MNIRGLIISDKNGVDHNRVLLDNVQLSHRESCKVVNHSPTGFAWGYGGSGPAQLALAILLTRTDEETAVRLHQKFKGEYITLLPPTMNFETEIDVDGFIRKEVGELVKPSTLGLGEKDAADLADSSDGECTIGHEQNCVMAASRECDCECGGQNHGAAFA